MPVNWPLDFYIIQKWGKNDKGGKRKHIQVLIPPTLINVLTYFISVGFTSKPPKAFRDCILYPYTFTHFMLMLIVMDPLRSYVTLCISTVSVCCLRLQHTALPFHITVYWCINLLYCTGEITSDYGGIFLFLYWGYLRNRIHLNIDTYIQFNSEQILIF